MKLLASWFLATFIVIAVADQQHSQMGQTYTMATLTIRYHGHANYPKGSNTFYA